MSPRLPANSTPTDASILPEAAAARLLARACELEATGDAGFAVAELRAAAEEAGIPAHAFAAALAEHRRTRVEAASEAASPVVGVRARRWTWAVATAATAALLLAIGVRTVSPGPGEIVEEGIVLRCLAPGEAAELVRPLLRDRNSTVQYNPARAPRVLTVRGTPEVVERTKALLAEHEGGSSACTAASIPPVATVSP